MCFQPVQHQRQLLLLKDFEKSNLPPQRRFQKRNDGSSARQNWRRIM